MSADVPPLPLLKRHRPDDVDDLLRAFFQKEMPSPWPEFHFPEKPEKPLVKLAPSAEPRWYRHRSQFALAASVGLLLVGSLVIPNHFQNDVTRKDSEDNPILIGDQRPLPEKPLDGRKFLIRESLRQEKDRPTELFIEVYPRP